MRHNLPLLVSLLLLAAGCGGGGSTTVTPPVNHTFDLTPVLEGVDFPSSLRFAPDGRMFYTELGTGRVRIVQSGALLDTPFATLPVATSGEQGLLSMAFDPQYATNHFVYFFYSDANLGRDRVVRLTDNANIGTNMAVVVDDLPMAGNHNGGRIGFGADGKLYVTVGENGDPANSQNPSVLTGKLLRYNADGTIPADNPITGNPMWAMGLRNSFGLGFQPGTGTPFVSENGPGCDDEVNRIVRNGNYGWRPDQPCNDADPSFLAPAAKFNPTIAPAGIAFSTSNNYDFAGSLLMTSFNDGALRQFTFEGNAIATQRTLVTGRGNLLDVTQGPDGDLYVAGNDTIYRLTMTD